MRTAFANCGRISFARGNSSWARCFNQTLQSARGHSSVSFPVAPSTWRMLAASSPIALSKMGIVSVASEAPCCTGFAEQHGTSQSGMTGFSTASGDEVVESGDEVSDALSSTPASSHISYIKSLSDVIVFGTNWANEMGECCRLHYSINGGL